MLASQAANSAAFRSVFLTGTPRAVRSRRRPPMVQSDTDSWREPIEGPTGANGRREDEDRLEEREEEVELLRRLLDRASTGPGWAGGTVCTDVAPGTTLPVSGTTLPVLAWPELLVRLEPREEEKSSSLSEAWSSSFTLVAAIHSVFFFNVKIKMQKRWRSQKQRCSVHCCRAASCQTEHRQA